MAPPAKGTAEYGRYLKKQRRRRILARAASKLQKKRKAALPFVKAALWVEQQRSKAAIDSAVLQKNRYMRANNSLRRRNDDLLNTNCSLERRLLKAREELKATKALLAEETAKLHEEAARSCRAERALKRWELWHHRLSCRKPASFLQWLWKLGRPLPQAKDRCWGLGQ